MIRELLAVLFGLCCCVKGMDREHAGDLIYTMYIRIICDLHIILCRDNGLYNYSFMYIASRVLHWYLAARCSGSTGENGPST